MFNHFLTAKYRIVLVEHLRHLCVYKVLFKPEYSLFWREYKCDGYWRFSTYKGALTAAIHQEKLRRGILCDEYTNEYTNEYTSDQLLDLSIKDIKDA